MITITLNQFAPWIGRGRSFSFVWLDRTKRLLIFLASLIFFSIITAPVDAGSEYSSKLPLASQSLLLDGFSTDGLIVAVGERGHILLSQDNGHSWEQAIVPTQATLTGVFFYDKKLGWAVGHNAIILRTKNGGKNWERVYYKPQDECPLLDVLFLDKKNGFAVGAYGLFLGTSDGGNTWSSRQISNNDFHMNHIMTSESGKLYIAAESGMVYRSDDDGETWTELPSPYRGSFFGTLPLHDDVLLLFGLRGHMYRSEDAGKSWEEVKTKTEAMLTSGLLLSDNTKIVVGLGGTVLVSKDDGCKFRLHPQADRKGISTVVQGNDGTVIAIGEFGVKRLQLAEPSTN